MLGGTTGCDGSGGGRGLLDGGAMLELAEATLLLLDKDWVLRRFRVDIFAVRLITY
jgi:hypothetical protein